MNELNKTRSSIPRPSSVGHRGATTFQEQHGLAVLQATRLTASKSALWLAEALNEALVDYLASYAITHPSTPSEQARWNESLCLQADKCLELMAPGFSREHPPLHPVPEVYATLFHNGGPEGIKKAHLRWLGYDDEWQALDKIVDGLWLLRTFAANAQARWQEQKAGPDQKARRRVRKYLLTWMADLGRIYAQVFERLPSYSSAEGPFGRFSEAARTRVLSVREVLTDGGTDAAAYAELAQFAPERGMRFAKEQRETLQRRWKLGLSSPTDPASFRLGIVGEIASDDSDGD